MRVKVFNPQGQLVGPVEVAKVVKTDAEWSEQLTPAQFQVARGKGTERPFCGNLLDNKRQGVYACVCCGLPLFASHGKFNSGTGWPSFFQPVADENVATHADRSYGMVRTEILCARCDAHLGHVFEDGPPRPACATASTPSRSPSRTSRTCPASPTPRPARCRPMRGVSVPIIPFSRRPSSLSTWPGMRRMFHAPHSLTDSQRAELQALRRTDLPAVARDRLEMVLLSDAGWSAPRIARHLGRHPHTVGPPSRGSPPGARRRSTPSPRPDPDHARRPQVTGRLSELLGQDRTWTSRQLADALGPDGIVGHRQTRRYLALLRAGYRRTAQTVGHKQDPKKVERAEAVLGGLKKKRRRAG